MKKLILALLFIAFINIANATPAMCSLSATGGLLDSFLQNYYNAAQYWSGVIAPIANKLFWFWFTCEFLWQLTFKKILMNDLQKLYVFFVIRIFTAYFFAQCFVNQNFYIGIIQYFTNIGAQAGGFSVNTSSGNPFAGFSPSGIINVGLCSWNSLFAFLGANAGWASVVNVLMYGLPMVFITILITFAAIIMALAMIMLALEAYIVIYGGFILCGFAGSSWTQSYWQKYLSYVGGVAIRIFTMCLILGLMKVQINTIFAYIVTASSGTDYVRLIGVFFNTLICMVINAFVVLKVPSIAGAMLTGQVSGGLGDMISGAAMMMSGVSMIKAFSNNTGRMATNLAQTALSTAGSVIPTASGISNAATTSASTAAKAAGEAGGKAAAISQNVGGSTSANEPVSNKSSTAEKLDTLSNAKVNNNQSTSTGNQTQATSFASAANSSGNNDNALLGGSNGISGGNSGSIPQSKSTGAKINEAGRHLGKLGEQAGRMSGGGHSGGAELNINPHRE